MVAWLLLIIVAVAAADPQMNLFDEESSYWGGPERGCGKEEGAGQMILSCTLPSGNITLYVDRSALSLKIICEKNSTLVCEELQEAKRHIDSYIVTDKSRDRHISFMQIDTCNLSSESLACPLGIVGASGTALVRLQEVGGELEPVHVEGLEGVAKFRMYDVDENITAVPFNALSLLPTLKSFSMKGASLVLKSEEPVLQELVTLELAEGNLKSLPKGAFRNTPSVQTLLLWGNKIEYVDVDAFDGLTHLVNLSLNANLISHLPAGLFRFSPHLGRVDLYVNKLLDLSEDLFSGLQELKEIMIFSNNAPLKLHNRTFSNLPSLHNLKLERSFIENVPADLFINTTNLKTFSLKGNNIKSLPNIFSKQKLISLNLSNNSLSYISRDIFNEQDSLVQLELQKNDLKILPDGLFSKLKSLKTLDLSNNDIKTLNISVFNGLNSLTELSLAGNRIEHLSDTVFEFIISLEVLSLARNNLTISKNENIIKLFSNPFYNLGDDDSDLQIEETYESPFRHLASLKSLDLSHNNVSIICDDWARMFRLIELDLSYNSLTSLTDVDMNFSTNVTVDLRHNNIQQFQLKYNTQTDTPTFLMNNNPYNCDCKLYDFISSYKSEKKMAIVKMDRAKCAQPEKLKGVMLTELKAELLTCEIDCLTGSLISHKNQSNCDCIIHPNKSRLEMTCDEIPDVYPPLPQETISTYIKLKHPTDIPQLPPQVKIVDLSFLNLTEAPKANSIELNLTNNYIKTAPIDLLERNCTLHLKNNQFDCSCEEKDNVIILNKYKNRIPDYKFLTCSNKILVSNIIVDQLCAARDAAIIGSSLAVFGLILAILTAIAYRYPTEIRILLRKLGLWYGKKTEGEVYDAFVSFAHQDEQFVRQKLIPKLENGKPSLNICVHYRDWIIGDYIPAQIARSVDESRYTIIVLSKNFVNSMWGRMEFRTAHTKDRVIILMLDDLSADKSLDPDLRAYIAMNTYVKADDPLVWDRLKDAVLNKKKWIDDSKLDKLAPTGLNVQLEDGKLVNKALTAPSV